MRRTDCERHGTGFQAAKKAASLPEFSLIDAGGGVLVDLDADGNEIYSERKVHVNARTHAPRSLPAECTNPVSILTVPISNRPLKRFWQRFVALLTCWDCAQSAPPVSLTSCLNFDFAILNLFEPSAP